MKDSEFMPLGLGSKHFILQNSIFYPHSENIITFKNLIFYSFSSHAALDLKKIVSCAGLLNLLMPRKRANKAGSGSSSLLINLSFLLSFRKTFFLAQRSRRKILKRRRSKRFYRKTNARVTIFKLNFRQLFQKFKRLKRKALKSKILIRRFLGKMRRKLSNPNSFKLKFIEKYRMGSFFVFPQKCNTSRPGVHLPFMPKLCSSFLSTPNFLIGEVNTNRAGVD